MSTIIVPLDFSDVTPRQLEVLQAHLPQVPCKIRLIHVHHAEVPLDNIGTIEADREHATAERNQLEAAETFLRGNLQHRQDVDIDSDFYAGPVTKTLLKVLAECEDAELIVMGTHGHGRLFSMLLGSAAEALLRKSEVPILFVPAPKGTEQL